MTDPYVNPRRNSLVTTLTRVRQQEQKSEIGGGPSVRLRIVSGSLSVRDVASDIESDIASDVESDVASDDNPSETCANSAVTVIRVRDQQPKSVAGGDPPVQLKIASGGPAGSDATVEKKRAEPQRSALAATSTPTRAQNRKRDVGDGPAAGRKLATAEAKPPEKAAKEPAKTAKSAVRTASLLVKKVGPLTARAKPIVEVLRKLSPVSAAANLQEPEEKDGGGDLVKVSEPSRERIMERPMEGVRTDIRPPDPEKGLPPDFARQALAAEGKLQPEYPTRRDWMAHGYQWEASSLCHRPLYFEEVNLERYGYSCCRVLQPVISGAHFFSIVPILPYKMTIQPPCERVYTLGHYRPGSLAPYRIHWPPLRPTAAGVQGALVTGLIFAIP